MTHDDDPHRHSKCAVMKARVPSGGMRHTKMVEMRAIRPMTPGTLNVYLLQMVDDPASTPDSVEEKKAYVECERDFLGPHSMATQNF